VRRTLAGLASELYAAAELVGARSKLGWLNIALTSSSSHTKAFHAAAAALAAAAAPVPNGASVLSAAFPELDAELAAAEVHFEDEGAILQLQRLTSLERQPYVKV
jgi:hypothetical protein